MSKNHSTGTAREEQQFVKQKKTVQAAGGGSGANLQWVLQRRHHRPPRVYIWLEMLPQLPVTNHRSSFYSLVVAFIIVISSSLSTLNTMHVVVAILFNIQSFLLGRVHQPYLSLRWARMDQGCLQYGF